MSILIHCIFFFLDEGEDADEATGAESSSDKGEDAGPESSNDETAA